MKFYLFEFFSLFLTFLAEKVNEMTAEKSRKLVYLEKILSQSASNTENVQQDTQTVNYESETLNEYKQTFQDVPELVEANQKLLEEMVEQIDEELGDQG